jgi:hypothetical protein
VIDHQRYPFVGPILSNSGRLSPDYLSKFIQFRACRPRDP